ncbi:glycosyltransferase [Desulfovibrio sp. ZJ369]|uniref:glycosyltransferase n=1 Tax=Desulfovibrio sp. ZJ369 TaxID=2709793 RepID=UPI0013ED0D5A|nr:glycosyltransferase [Desulfovibrio sp. ZJ369]
MNNEIYKQKATNQQQTTSMSDTSRDSSLVRQAYSYFKNRNYNQSLSIYNNLSKTLGAQYFNANMVICKKKLGEYLNTKNLIDITIIIPAYNADKYIKRAIDSVINQTISNIEIIIFDDCSTDNTVNIIREYQLNNTDIKLLQSKKKVGQGIGRNEALQYASGKFITFLDADDYYIDNFYLESLLKVAIKEKADIVVTPYARVKNGVFRYDSLEENILNGSQAAQKFLSRQFGTHGPGGKLFHRNISIDNKFVKYGYSQDVLYMFTTLLSAQRVYITKHYGYAYVQDNPSSWRPDHLTDLHFFSSLRLLSEIWAECLQLTRGGQHFSIADFNRLWCKDHGPRIASYLLQHSDDPWTRTLTSAFDGIRAFLLQLLNPNRTYKVFYSSPYYFINNKSKVTEEALHYARKKSDIICHALDECFHQQCKNESRELIVIYISHLSSGGLERVAAQLGMVLSSKYDIIYILDNPKRVEFSHPGKILKADLFDDAVRTCLDRASFIFDFKYKSINGEYPICLYCIDRYSYKYIVTVHNTKTCNAYIEKIRDYLGKKTFKSLYGIICVSSAVKSELTKLYGADGRIEVIHNPVNLREIDTTAECNDMINPFILFAGRLNASQHKGIDILLRAWLDFQNKYNYRLALAGAGELEPSMKNLLNSYEFDPQVDILGFRNDIYALMKKALFVVAPSRWEGFSMTLIESLACGTPVLSTKSGGASEILRNGVNGYFININDVKDTIKGLQYMFKHADEMKENCRSSIISLDLGIYKSKILHFLNKYEKNYE